ncbi:MAG: hypothetical protein HQL88_11310 [Magnetococcales bacterium]|nr:hypothetical protein [Magnetococcales bacterium]
MREDRDMARKLDDVIKGLPIDQQQEIEELAAHLIDTEMTLRDSRIATLLCSPVSAHSLHTNGRAVL